MASVFDPLRLGSVGLDVLSAARQRPQDIAARQTLRLSQLLEAVASGSPMYRQILHGTTPASTVLRDLPVVTKSELMHRFSDWVTDPQLELDDLRRFTADPERIGEPYLQKYVVWESSGTSGQPGIFVQDARAMAVYDALEALRRSSPRPWLRMMDPLFLTERMAFIGAITGHFASQVSVQRLRRLQPWMASGLRSFSILQPVADLVAQLNRFAPTIVATYPTVAVLLADEAQRGALTIAPGEIWTGGETLTASMRNRVQQAFDCSVRNNYGASEFLSLGWECSHGGMHANTDWLILEPVDAQGQPVAAGEPSHTTLLTNLANRVQPLIRYDLGDQISIRTEPCACGSPLPVIDVQGRQDDALVMTGRDGRPVTLLPLALTTVLEDEAGVFDFQLRQCDAATLALRLGPEGPETASASAFARCQTALQAFAQRQGLGWVQVIQETGRPVPRGRSGKVQRVTARSSP